jgi:asparagine synthase (glutamine-hydrolysing)
MGVLDDAFRALDYEGLRWLMRMGYIPAPWTPFSGVYKVPHGTYLTVRPQDSPPSSVESFRAKCRRYWNGTLFAEESRKRGTLRDAEQAVKVLESALEASVARRMVADVPLGAFLSGGIDSSLVASLMAKLSATQVQTYTIGFDDASMDETDHAARVADALRTDHHVERFRTDDALALVSELHTIYDEPLADPSQLPTVLLCRTARRHVKVALSGDGGDELFFGYQRHFNALGMWRYLSRVPPHLRRMGGAVLERLGTRVPSRARRHWRRKAFLDSRDASVLHVAMSEHWSVPGEDLGYVDELHSSRLGAMANMRLFDQAMYLPGALMPKCDRASMAVGLELRMPFLEIDVLQLAWRMPDDFLFRASQGKWILRKLLARHLPRDITDRKKQGFAVPLARWLRNELRNWAESLVEEAQDTHSGCLDTAALRGLWQSHLRGQEDASDPLWTALSLLAWLRSCPTAARLICA